MTKKYYVYMLLTEQKTLYCGYTDNVEKRVARHFCAEGAKYTKANKPIRIVYCKEFSSKTEALKEEYRIKHKLTRNQKIQLLPKTIQNYF